MGRGNPDTLRHRTGRAALRQANRFTIEWLSSADEIPAGLWDKCFRPPLEGKFWYRALEKCGMDEQFTFYYGLIKDADRPVGIAPAFKMDVPMDLVAPLIMARVLEFLGKFIPGIDYQRTLFIGSVCADEGTVGILPAYRLEDIAPHLQNAIEEKARQIGAPMIVWRDFPNHEIAKLKSLTESHSMFSMVSYPGAVVDLPSSSYSDYQKALKGSRRHNLRKKLKRSHEMGELAVTVETSPSQQTLDQAFNLFWQTYEKGETKFEKLTPEFFRLIAESKESHFVSLRLPASGQLVAFMLCFKLGDRIVNKFIGLDYGFDGKWYLYFRLWEAAVKWALVEGATEFQSGQTGYRAKIDVGHRLIPLTNLCKHRNPLINRIYALIAGDISWRSLDDDLKIYLAAHPEDSEKQFV